jgi:hypothetical protein
MTIYRYVVPILLLVAMPLLAESNKDKAKKLYKEAQLSTSQIDRIRKECDAAAIDPNNNEIVSACSQDRRAFVRQDELALSRAAASLKDRNFEKAKVQAGYVSDLDKSLSDQAKSIIQDANEALKQKAAETQVAKTEPPPPPATVVSPPPPPVAPAPQQQAQTQTPQQPPASNSPATGAGASQSAQNTASSTSPGGSPHATPRVTNPQTAGDKDAKDKAAKVTEQLASARKLKETGDAGAALIAYEGVLKLESSNLEARAGRDQMHQLLSNDPRKLDPMLVSAIRRFYASDFSHAGPAFEAYLDVSQGRNSGVAHFYLGATLLAQSILNTSAAQRTTVDTNAAKEHFRQARVAGYKPIPKFVSPALMAVWKESGT